MVFTWSTVSHRQFQDPKLYMIRWLAERCSDEQLENSGLERKKCLGEILGGDEKIWGSG